MVRAVRALMGWEVTPCDSGYGRGTIDIRHWSLIDFFVPIPLRYIGWIKAQEANSPNATKALRLLRLLRLVALLWLGEFKKAVGAAQGEVPLAAESVQQLFTHLNFTTTVLKYISYVR